MSRLSTEELYSVSILHMQMQPNPSAAYTHIPMCYGTAQHSTTHCNEQSLLDFSVLFRFHYSFYVIQWKETRAVQCVPNIEKRNDKINSLLRKLSKKHKNHTLKSKSYHQHAKFVSN